MIILIDGANAGNQLSLMALGAIKKSDLKPRLDSEGNQNS